MTLFDLVREILHYSRFNIGKYRTKVVDISEKNVEAQKKTQYHCLCGKLFGDKSNFRAHFRRHNNSTMKPLRKGQPKKENSEKSGKHQCQRCEKMFRTPSALTMHQRIYTKETPYKCDECDKRFNNKSNSFVHRRRHSGTMAYKCDYCARRFTHSNGRKAHERRHTGAKPYKCGYCGGTFTQSGHASRHEKWRHKTQ